MGKMLINKYVKKQEIIPWSIFPKKYDFIEISDFETILNTCNKIEIPPKPSKKALIIILVERFLFTILQHKFKPFVNSQIPDAILVIKLGEIPSDLKTGDSKKKIVLKKTAIV